MAEAKNKQENPEAAEIKALQKENADLRKQIAESDTALEELNAVNNDLTEMIEELEAAGPSAEKKVAKKATIPNKPFKVGKESYVFTAPQFTNPMEGKGHAVITAKEALTDKDLLAYLVENDCGVTKRASE